MEEWHQKICSLSWPQFLKALAALNLDPSVFGRLMSAAEREMVLWPMLSGETSDDLEAAYRSAVAARLSGEKLSRQEPKQSQQVENPQAEALDCCEEVKNGLASIQETVRGLVTEIGRVSLKIDQLERIPAQEKATGAGTGGTVDTNPRVFICYNREDEVEVAAFESLMILRCGILVERDVNSFSVGKSFWPQIEETARRCNGLLVAVGHHGFSAIHEQEAEHFHQVFRKRGAPVIPVLMPSTPPGLQLPWFLNSFVRLDLRELSYLVAAQKVFEAVGAKSRI